MLRTIFVALCVLPLALPVGACSGTPDRKDGDPRKTRIVCVSGGTVVYDDFAKRGATFAEGGGLLFTSVTTGERTRVAGSCHAYTDLMPAGWKATFPVSPTTPAGTPGTPGGTLRPPQGADIIANPEAAR
jgi:hypothetical protein